jgi:tetratricopeptide (TPR) repeat protein
MHAEPQVPSPVATAASGPPTAARSDRAARYIRCLFEFGERLFRWQLFAEAADLFEYLASRRPHEPWTWFWLARCHEQLGNPLRAARLYEVALDIGEPATFALLAAQAWKKAGEPERAQAVLRAHAVQQGERLCGTEVDADARVTAQR